MRQVCCHWHHAVQLEGLEENQCRASGQGRELQTHILILHGVQLFQFLGPVSGLLLRNVCGTRHKHNTSLEETPLARVLDVKGQPSGSSKRVSSSSRWKVGSLVPQISFSAIMALESSVSHWPGPSWGDDRVEVVQQNKSYR